MERPGFIRCRVCQGTPFDHGEHDWRFDKWSLTDPVVWRCRDCNAVAEMCSREQFHAAADGGFAYLPHVVQLRRLESGELHIAPCDVCGGTGTVQMRDDTESNRVRAFVARRAAKSWVGLMPRIGPRLRERDLAVLSTCPRCGKSDRSVPVIQTIGASADEGQLALFGEAIIDGCEGETAHYCGRCGIEFGSSSEEFMAGLR